jgi:NAD(P)-dependent dehydrogenase (short-subunit alcohol dehydrogenase family)
MDIKGKVALVTGGQRRLGRAMAVGLAEVGANVVVAHFEDEDLAVTAVEEIESKGVEGMRIKIDVASKQSVDSVAEEVIKRFGGVDILINSSSFYRKAEFPSDDTSVWDRSLGIILNGPYYTSNAFAPGMLERSEGVIINIVDLSLWETWPNFTGHCVAKTGLWALTRQLALELAPSVRVNAIAPGPMIPPVDFDEAKIARTADKTLLNRWGVPENTVQTVRFIVQNDYLTGTVIPVDGGQRFAHRKYEEG